MGVQAVPQGEAAIEAELALIGSFILDPKARINVAAFVSTNDICDKRMAVLHRVITSMEADGKAVDLVTVRAELESRKLYDQIGGEHTLALCQQACEDPNNVAEYAEYVRTAAAKRRLANAVDNASSTGALLAAIDNEAHSLRRSPLMKSDRGITADVMARRVAESFMDTTSGEVFPFPPELEQLNRITGGIRRGEFVVVGAGTNVGKTIFGIQLLTHYSKQGLSVLFGNNEMVLTKMENMLIKALTGLAYFDIEKRDLEHQATIMGAMKELTRYKYEILRPKVWSAVEIASIQARDGYDVVIYDHINRVGSDPGEIADVARKLRTIALEYNCAVICLQQLNESAEGLLPTKHSLRGSKTPGEEADQLLLLHRDRMDPRSARIIVDKSRTSGRGSVTATFNERFIRFEEA